eukprot:TRINITY_DN9987_c0_g1_i1.p1 TRINITY_DN9987_c0_g1~~TRINITY_DN9987_c0_g1_i1.p1  ORF type:complete len:249 (-),score=46.52 TRINITY_DN9987_c0_g1_i1:75-821(-)
MWTRFLAALCFVGLTSSSILVEIAFDLALSQETESGYTSSHTVGEFLKNPNLLHLRYTNTLTTGLAGNAPMRTALMEFKSYKSWAAFEHQELPKTNVLLDLFWINWRKLVWESDDSLTVRGTRPQDEALGGYFFSIRFSVDPSKESQVSRFIRDSLPAKDLLSTDGFIERKGYTSGFWQSDYTNFIIWEFTTMDALIKTIYDSPTVMATFEQAKKNFFKEYAITINVPSSGAKGGQFHRGPKRPSVVQ